MGWTPEKTEQLKKLIQPLKKTGYGKYLKNKVEQFNNKTHWQHLQDN